MDKNARRPDLSISVYLIAEDDWVDLSLARMLALNNDPPRNAFGVDLETTVPRPQAVPDPEPTAHVFEILNTHHVLRFEQESEQHEFVKNLYSNLERGAVKQLALRGKAAVTEQLRARAADPEWQVALAKAPEGTRKEWAQRMGLSGPLASAHPLTPQPGSRK